MFRIHVFVLTFRDNSFLRVEGLNKQGSLRSWRRTHVENFVVRLNVQHKWGYHRNCFLTTDVAWNEFERKPLISKPGKSNHWTPTANVVLSRRDLQSMSHLKHLPVATLNLSIKHLNAYFFSNYFESIFLWLWGVVSFILVFCIVMTEICHCKNRWIIFLWGDLTMDWRDDNRTDHPWDVKTDDLRFTCLSFWDEKVVQLEVDLLSSDVLSGQIQLPGHTFRIPF